MVGFDTMHAQLVKIVRQVSPPAYDRDRGFRTVEGADGRGPDLEHVLAEDRFFDIRLISPPYDAGYSGANGLVNRAKLEIRVRYNTGDRGRRTRKAGVDGGVITQAILDPNRWDEPNSGIRTMTPPGPDDVSIERVEEGDEEDGIAQDTVLAKIQLTVEYLEQHAP